MFFFCLFHHSSFCFRGLQHVTTIHYGNTSCHAMGSENFLCHFNQWHYNQWQMLVLEAVSWCESKLDEWTSSLPTKSMLGKTSILVLLGLTKVLSDASIVNWGRAMLVQDSKWSQIRRGSSSCLPLILTLRKVLVLGLLAIPKLDNLWSLCCLSHSCLVGRSYHNYLAIYWCYFDSYCTLSQYWYCSKLAFAVTVSTNVDPTRI